MSAASPAEATASSSSTPLGTTRFPFLRDLSHIVRVSGSLATERLARLQLGASETSQVAEDISAPFVQPQGLSTDPSPATSTVSTEVPVTAQNGRSVEIPYPCRSIYIFPDASTRISQAHRERYPALKDICQRNIEDSRKLSKFTTCISYELRLCGSCLADAVPSIVVFCPRKKWKKIESLLTQPHLRTQFEPETVTPKSVRFGLVFWAQTIEMLASHDVTLIIPDEQHAGGVGRSAPWGLHITDSDQGDTCTTTLSCLVQVAGVRFGLATAHGFRRPWAAPAGTDSMDSDDSDTDDEENSTFTARHHHNKAIMEVRPASSLHGREHEVKLGNSPVYVPPHEDTSAWLQGHANLDWALLTLGLEEAEMSKYSTAATALPIANHLPEQCLDVFIITRANLDVPAKLYNIPSYIGGVKGSPAAEVWTVGGVPETMSIQKGDSGSIVLGARSGELYGMVMAVNPFGDIYIAPFTAILAQVKELFETQDVSVLTLPRHPRSFTTRPGLGASKPSEEQNLPWVFGHEGNELASGAEPHILNQSDDEELGWPPRDTLERPLRSSARDRTGILSTDEKVESVNAPTAGPTFSSLEDGPIDQQDAQSYTSADGIGLLTQANLRSQAMPNIVCDIQAWIDGDPKWLRKPDGEDQKSGFPFAAMGTSCHSSQGSLDFVFIPSQPSDFRRDALAIGAGYEDTLHSSNLPDLDIDEI